MARNFDGSSGFLSSTTAAASGYPFTVAGWFRHTDVADDSIFSIFHSASSNSYRGGITSAHELTIVVFENAVSTIATTTNGASINEWTHATFVFASATDRRVYLNANQTTAGSSTTNSTPANTMDRTRFGANSTVSNRFGGDLYLWAVWPAALSINEIESLYNGAHPNSVGSAAYCWEFTGDSPEVSSIGALDLTVNGTTSFVANPNIWRSGTLPRRRRR